MNILSTIGLSKRFGGLNALDKLDIAIEQGTIHGLIGPNGSGKTTTFNVISGLLPTTEGKIYFNSVDITNLSPFQITKMGISRTFQMPRVMEKLSIIDNVMVGMYCRTTADVAGTFLRIPFTHSKQETRIKKRALELLDFVGLADSANRWAIDLVWAERQLLQIARALLTEPQLLLLDEPAAGMGEEEMEKMKGIIKQINKTGVTVVLIAHDVKLITQLSEKITAIEFGKKIAEGTPDEVKKNPKVVEAYLGTD